MDNNENLDHLHVVRMSRKNAQLLGLFKFYPLSTCKRGHYGWRYTTGACKECLIEKAGTEEAKKRKRDNARKRYGSDEEHRAKEQKRLAALRRTDKGRANAAERTRRYYHSNERYREKKKERNRSQPYRDKRNKTRREKYKNCHDYRLSVFIRRSLRRVFESAGLRRDNVKRNCVGYTREDLAAHLERQFLDGMTWENYGEKWHIDHIVPLSKLIKDGVTDPSIINALSNLRPLWKECNLKKKDSSIFLI